MIVERQRPQLLFNMSCRPQADVRLRGARVAVAWRIEIPDESRWIRARQDRAVLAAPLSELLIASLFELPGRSRFGREEQLSEVGIPSSAFASLPAVAPVRRDQFAGPARALPGAELAVAILGRVRGHAFVKSSRWRLTALDLECPTVVFLPAEWKP